VNQHIQSAIQLNIGSLWGQLSRFMSDSVLPSFLATPCGSAILR
jgi:hypothetical protein